MTAEFSRTILEKGAYIGCDAETALVPTGTIATDGDKKYIFVLAHAGLTAYQPYRIDHNGTVVASAAPATNANQVTLVGVPQTAITSGNYGWLQIQGNAEVLHIAETYAAGDHLEVLNTGAALVVDGTSSSTTKSEKSVGVTIDAGTTAVAATVYLYGNPVVVAAA